MNTPLQIKTANIPPNQKLAYSTAKRLVDRLKPNSDQDADKENICTDSDRSRDDENPERRDASPLTRRKEPPILDMDSPFVTVADGKRPGPMRASADTPIEAKPECTLPALDAEVPIDRPVPECRRQLDQEVPRPIPNELHVTFATYITYPEVPPLLDNRSVVSDAAGTMDTTDAAVVATGLAALPPKPVVTPYNQDTFEQAIAIFLHPRIPNWTGARKWLDEILPATLVGYMKGTGPTQKKLYNYIVSLRQRRAFRELHAGKPTLALFYYLKNSYPYFYSHNQQQRMIAADREQMNAAVNRELDELESEPLHNARAPRMGTLGSLPQKMGRL